MENTKELLLELEALREFKVNTEVAIANIIKRIEALEEPPKNSDEAYLKKLLLYPVF